jgi:wyosine [tRNA(Phe)-imidazoG37] synthetase (radical SAM superfamily)
MAVSLIDRIVYGPVPSRRLGRSLGINLLPAGMKVCNMNCAYCQYGWTRRTQRQWGRRTEWPSVQAVEAAVTERLARAAATDEIIDRLTIAGHGEPTLHPEFDEVVKRIAAVRNRVAPALPVAVLSNSTTAGFADVRSGLARCDERYMKLDAGDPFMLGAINGCPASFVRLVDALRALPPITIQAMFVHDRTGAFDNASDATLNLWLSTVQTIGAAGVHIYTIDRLPALTSLRPVSARRLRDIAERVRRAGIPAEVFAARRSYRDRVGSNRNPHDASASATERAVRPRPS